MLERSPVTHIDLLRLSQNFTYRIATGSLSDGDAWRLCEVVSAVFGEMLLEPRVYSANVIGFRPLHNPPLRADRTMNTLDFAALSLMCVAGARVVEDTTTSGGKVYSYLRYEHPNDFSDDMRIRVSRIILNAPPEQAVGFVNRPAYRNYCRDNLKLRKPISGMQEPKCGRETAIKLALSLYDAYTPNSLSYLSAQGYEAMLRNLFAAADRYHAEKSAT